MPITHATHPTPPRPARRRVVIIALALVASAVIGATSALAASRFLDVPDDHTFAEDIAWLADTGVTRGCNPPANDRFCADQPVTRGQMAAFLHRLADAGVVDAATLDGLTADTFATADDLAAYATLDDLPDLDTYMTEGDLPDLTGYLTDDDLDGYALVDDLAIPPGFDLIWGRFYNSPGSLMGASRGIVSGARTDIGHYLITLERDPLGCAVTVTPRASDQTVLPGPGVLGPARMASFTPTNAFNNTLSVTIRDDAGTPINTAFDLIAICTG